MASHQERSMIFLGGKMYGIYRITKKEFKTTVTLCGGISPDYKWRR